MVPGHGRLDWPPPPGAPQAHPLLPTSAAATAVGTITTSRTPSCTPCKSWLPSWCLRSLRTSSVTWECECQGGQCAWASSARRRGSGGQFADMVCPAPSNFRGVKSARLRGCTRALLKSRFGRPQPRRHLVPTPSGGGSWKQPSRGLPRVPEHGQTRLAQGGAPRSPRRTDGTFCPQRSVWGGCASLPVHPPTA